MGLELGTTEGRELPHGLHLPDWCHHHYGDEKKSAAAIAKIDTSIEDVPGVVQWWKGRRLLALPEAKEVLNGLEGVLLEPSGGRGGSHLYGRGTYQNLWGTR